MFISFDGIDGAGKSTQFDLLKNFLEGRGENVACFRDPGSTRLGEAIREILLHREDIPLASTAEMLLYMASRAQLVEELIRPALSSGTTVICDRFLLANVVYQGVAGGLDVSSLWSVGKIATGGLAPDVTFVLDLDPHLAFQRIQRGHDRLEKRGLDYFERVRVGFQEQLSSCGGRGYLINANRSVDTIHREIVSLI